MIWIASFPRSGNTFLRNILKECYDINTGSYPEEDSRKDKKYHEYPFVKTHVLPSDLPEEYRDAPSVYLIRDGRDSIVSLSHYKKSFIDKDSNLELNMFEAIKAENMSFFGGWVLNACQWAHRSIVIIRFEDLINDPIAETEKLRKVYPDLPTPDVSKLPTFESQKQGFNHYGNRFDQWGPVYQIENFTQSFFRKGKIGSWKEEMPHDLKLMYWAFAGQDMEMFGYTENGEIKPLSKTTFQRPPKDKKILLVARRMLDTKVDGTKRYTDLLLKGLYKYELKYGLPFELYIQTGSVVSLDAYFNPHKREIKFKILINRFLAECLAFFPKLLLRLLPEFVYFKVIYPFKQTTIGQLYKKVILKLIRRNIHIQAKEKLDLVHYTTPDLQETQTKILCTVHDLSYLLFKEFHRHETVQSHIKYMDHLVKNGGNFLAISNHTKHDLLKHYDVTSKDVSVVYEGVDKQLFFPIYDQIKQKKVLKKYGLTNEKYFVCVNTLEPRKNLKNTLRAFIRFCEISHRDDIKFVLCGQKGWKMSQLPSHKNIVRCGYVPDNDLAILYGSALALCYLSYYEGFGLPPVEAMRCKTVPIYGDNSSMREIIGEAGLAANPDDMAQISSHMQKITADRKFRKKMEQLSFERSLKFTTEKMVLKTLNEYQLLIGNNHLFSDGLKL